MNFGVRLVVYQDRQNSINIKKDMVDRTWTPKFVFDYFPNYYVILGYPILFPGFTGFTVALLQIYVQRFTKSKLLQQDMRYYPPLLRPFAQIIYIYIYMPYYS